MPAIRKTYTAKVLGTGDPAAADQIGTFEAIVAVFGNVDSDGDIVEKGAFAETIKAWMESANPLPMLWSHGFSDPDNVLGHIAEAKETDEGLWIRGVFDLDHPKAARVHKLMTQGLIVEFSWSGEVLEYEWIEPEEPTDWWWAGMKMLKIDLWEAGPCFKGANDATSLISIKAADNVGRMGERIRLQAKNADPTQQQEQPRPPAPAATPEPEAVPATEPTADQQAADAADPATEPTPESVQGPDPAMKARALLELTLINQ